jgi:Ala-tRNA(Pro) deacylase
MSTSPKIKAYLEERRVPFEILEHSLAYTALEIAGAQHIPGREVVKSVIVKANDRFYMCVLPAIHYLDIERFKQANDVKEARLAHEEEIAALFPEYETGAEPPFGNLYGLKVIVDKILEEDENIVFNAGTHTEMIKMKFKDFAHLVQPEIQEIGTHIKFGRIP